ncbi:MAG: hypothetical protein Q8K26_03475, partial [Candidatus Gracilibacteria bacterium]|nr:hypothetical protein [Candidatus Gracilibacteria bacterium]
LHGTYDRIQYNSDEPCSSLLEIIRIIELGNSYLDDSKKEVHLDIRLIIDKALIDDLPKLNRIFGDIDISIKKYDNEEVFYLMIGKNTSKRALELQEIEDIKTYVKNKINSTLAFLDQLGGFEEFAISELEKIRQMGFTFEKDNFSVDEIYSLWSNSFGWTKETIGGLLNSLNGDNFLYGLRNEKGELISLVLISAQETTEWATRKDYQGRKLIESLLIFANSHYINNLGKGNAKLYVHARYNRSVTPAVKSGMKFFNNDELQYLLTNLVKVDGEYQTFVEGVLDSSLYTDKIIQEYISSNL